MSGKIRFNLMAQVIERRWNDGPSHLTASVYVWRGEQCVATVPLFDIADVKLEDSIEIDSAEYYALVMARVLARRLATLYNEATDAGKLHTRQAYQAAE